MPMIAALPMYEYPENAAAHEILWSSIARHLIHAGLRETPRTLTRDLAPLEIWRHPRLLLAQACEYPLTKHLQGRVRVVASPCYSAPGCVGATYRSAIVVRDSDAAQTLSALRGRRCVINDPDSNSGMNLLRAAIAPLSRDGRFFGSVAHSGSHRRSARMVADGEADVAAIDCVSYAHFQRLDAAVTSRLRVLCWSESTPSLPYITAVDANEAQMDALRASLAHAVKDPALADLRAGLFLQEFDLHPTADFMDVLKLERRATAFGYPELR